MLANRALAGLVLILGLALHPSAAVVAMSRPDPDVAQDPAMLKSALELVRQGRYEDAERVAESTHDPLVQKFVTWLRLTREDEPGDYLEARRFLEANPDWPSQYALRRQVERSMPLGGDPAEVLKWFETHPALTIEGTVRHVNAVLGSGREAGAAELAARQWVELDMAAGQERDYLARYGRHIDRQDHQARLQRLLWDRRSDAAMRQGHRLGPDYAALARARMSLAYMRADVDGAISRLPERFLDDAGFVYDRARWRQRKNRFEDVVALIDPPRAAVPHPEKWWPLRLWVAREAMDRNHPELAYRQAAAHGLTSGIGFAESEWLAGWLALRWLDTPERAYRHFVTLYEGVESEISRSRGAYWAGEAALAQGNRPDAAIWYAKAAKFSATFYGQLASYRMGSEPKVDLEPMPPIPDEHRSAFTNAELPRLVRLLGRIDEDYLQRRFLNHLRLTAKGTEDFALVAELAEEQGVEDIAVMTAKTARREGISLDPYLYPRLEVPDTRHPEPALVLALIRQESQFDREAVSSAGARGLMQLMPATARTMAGKLGVRYRPASLTEDPHYNVRLGRSYLSQLLEEFDNSYILALAAYNAGPHRARSWIRRFGDPRSPGTDPVDWIERIPFAETRNYVQRVIESLVVYRSFHPGTQTSWLLKPVERPS